MTFKTYRRLCDQAQDNQARIELWTGREPVITTLRVVTNHGAHTTPIVAGDYDEAAQRLIDKDIF